MLPSVLYPFPPSVAPVAPHLAALAATAAESVANTADRDTAVQCVMVANGHPINREGV